MKRSRVLREVHETATAMRQCGVIDKRTMREFDALALPRAHDLSPKESRALQVPNARATGRAIAAPIPRRDLKAFGQVYALVAGFFGSRSKTAAWFQSANPLLGGVCPMEMVLSGRARRLLRFVKQTDAAGAQAMPPKLSRAWMQEIDRRAAEVDSGTVRTIPWAAARARLRRKSKALIPRKVRT